MTAAQTTTKTTGKLRTIVLARPQEVGDIVRRSTGGDTRQVADITESGHLRLVPAPAPWLTPLKTIRKTSRPITVRKNNYWIVVKAWSETSEKVKEAWRARRLASATLTKACDKVAVWLKKSPEETQEIKQAETDYYAAQEQFEEVCREERP